MFIKR